MRLSLEGKKIPAHMTRHGPLFVSCILGVLGKFEVAGKKVRGYFSIYFSPFIYLPIGDIYV
jgi:hypothetical protein